MYMRFATVHVDLSEFGWYHTTAAQLRFGLDIGAKNVLIFPSLQRTHSAVFGFVIVMQYHGGDR